MMLLSLWVGMLVFGCDIWVGGSQQAFYPDGMEAAWSLGNGTKVRL